MAEQGDPVKPVAETGYGRLFWYTVLDDF